MKQILIFAFAILATSSIYAQTKSPLATNEYCPNTEDTFTVSIPAAYVSINTIGGCRVTQNLYGFNTSNTT